MSKTTIIDKIHGIAKDLKAYSFGIFNVKDSNKTTTIKQVDYSITDYKQVNYANTKINFTPIQTKATTMLPFRVRFTTIGEGGEGIPPIGIAIIGYNNYIL